jgi:hypothetical protein
VSVTGAILAGGLHATMRSGFAAASHPAWLVIAGCGLAVLVPGPVSTSSLARRTAVLAADRRGTGAQADRGAQSRVSAG